MVCFQSSRWNVCLVTLICKVLKKDGLLNEQKLHGSESYMQLGLLSELGPARNQKLATMSTMFTSKQNVSDQNILRDW